MDLRKIRTLLQLMDENQLAEMELEEEGMKIKFSKFSSHATPMTQMAPMVMPVEAQPPQEQLTVQESQEESGQTIASPIPGTFYHASGPDKPPFVKVGDRVDSDTVVCIIEAMKVMNEIKAECSGTIAEILVDNAEPVEYGKPLFRIV